MGQKSSAAKRPPKRRLRPVSLAHQDARASQRLMRLMHAAQPFTHKGHASWSASKASTGSTRPEAARAAETSDDLGGGDGAFATATMRDADETIRVTRAELERGVRDFLDDE